MQSNDDDELKEVPLGRSLDELTTPRSPLMPRVEVFDGHLSRIEASLRPSVPEEIRKRIGVVRDLAVYGAFCYDFITVSVFWAFTCVEMALWEKFAELNPGPLTVLKKKQQVTVTLNQLPSSVRHGFRIIGMPEFNGSFSSLVKWAIGEGLVPNDESLDAIVKLRNSFAHPLKFSPVLSPPMAVDVFQKLVEIVNHLWPLELAPHGGMLLQPPK